MIFCTRKNLPENQCVLVRGFRVTRVLRILPRRLRGAAEPNLILPGDSDDDESDKGLTSIASQSEIKVRDTAWLLSPFI
jgi:hypothetical protein